MATAAGVGSLADLNPGQRVALVEAVERLAALKHHLGLCLARACLGAPVLEACNAVAAMAQDELGHGRVLTGLAAGVDEVSAGEEARRLEEPGQVPEPLDAEEVGWLDALAASLVADGAARLVVAAAAECRIAPLRARAARMLGEEGFHQLYAEGWVERAAADPPVAAALAERLRTWLPPVVAWLGGLQRSAPVLADLGFRLPDGAALEDLVTTLVNRLSADVS